MVPSCLKAAGCRCSPLLPVWAWHWFVLAAFPAGKDGQSALKAEAEIRSLEGAEIYCSRKLKTHTLPFGVSLALPVPVWGKRWLCTRPVCCAGASWGGSRDTGENSQAGVTEP